jgi:hypothetical protein
LSLVARDLFAPGEGIGVGQPSVFGVFLLNGQRASVPGTNQSRGALSQPSSTMA